MSNNKGMLLSLVKKVKNVPYEKQYQVWILNLQYGNEYLEYAKRKLGIS